MLKTMQSKEGGVGNILIIYIIFIFCMIKEYI